MNLDQILLALQQRTISPAEAEALLAEAQQPKRVTWTFTGDEFFLADHVVKGAHVLPGVVYLEMARAAANAVCLKNVAWSRPFVAGETPGTLEVVLGVEEAGAIAYEIVSDDVHSQGIAVVRDARPIAPLNLGALRERCDGAPLTRAQIYGSFLGTGVAYGPAHRSLESVRTGTDAEGRRFVLADVALPQSIAATAGDYVLHPSIMDAALQAPIGFLLGNAAMKPALPFALGELRIVAPCPARAVVVVREAAGTSDKVRKLDIDICDAAGNVCVRLEDFSARVLDTPPATIGTMLLAPRLEAEAAPTNATNYTAHWVVFCEVDAPEIPGATCVRLSAEGDVARRFETHAVELLRLIQRILKDKPKGEVLLQLVVPANGDGWLFSGLSGLLKTAQLENPRLITQTIGVESDAGLAQKLRDDGAGRADAVVRHQRGTRTVTRFRELNHVQ